ncbi:MAG: hypothetical protein VX725_03250, partial [Actinomycetota bacterium]|nr:hypothetical protein [Actinomycetota bacterium]
MSIPTSTSVEILTQISGNSTVTLHQSESGDYVNVQIGSRSEPIALTGNDGTKLAAGAKTAFDHRIPL